MASDPTTIDGNDNDGGGSGGGEARDSSAHDPQQPQQPAEPQQNDALQRLGDQNRIQMEARMLPKTRDLTEEEIGGVRRRLQEYMTTHNLRLAKVSREVGYSVPTLSQWIAKRYPGSDSAVAHAVNDWMERDTRRRFARHPEGYVTTWVADTLRTIVHTADKRCMMAAIVAPAGSGKTKVLKILAEELHGIYLCCTRKSSWRSFLLELAEALDHRGRKRLAAAEYERYIIQELEGTRRMVLIDEAHMLGRAISSVRSIHDLAGVPIVMAGAAEILTLVDDRADGLGQFSRRCIQFNMLREIRGGGAGGGAEGGGDRLLFSLEEIRAFFDSRRIRLTRDALDLLWRLACLPNHGTLGLVDKVAQIAADLAEAESGEREAGLVDVVTRENVKAALSLFDNVAFSYMLRMAEKIAPAERPARAARSA